MSRLVNVISPLSLAVAADTSETITIQTDSYAAGTFGSTVVPAGGFALTGFLFDNPGNVLTLTNGSCGQVGLDPAMGNYDDLDFQDTLGPGPFTLALTTAFGALRTGNYAVSIAGADSVIGPEPSSKFLPLAGGALNALLRGRRSFNSR
jgi:hypothetical protein